MATDNSSRTYFNKLKKSNSTQIVTNWWWKFHQFQETIFRIHRSSISWVSVKVSMWALMFQIQVISYPSFLQSPLKKWFSWSLCLCWCGWQVCATGLINIPSFNGINTSMWHKLHSHTSTSMTCITDKYMFNSWPNQWQAYIDLHVETSGFGVNMKFLKYKKQSKVWRKSVGDLKCNVSTKYSFGAGPVMA